MRLKNVLTAVVLASMIFVTACGGGSSSSEAKNTDAGAATPKATPTAVEATAAPTVEAIKEHQELVYYVADTKPEDVEKYVKPFEDANNVTVKTISIKSDKFMEGFMAAHNAKQPIDVVGLNGQDVRFMANSGIIKSLEINYKDRFIPSAIDPYTFESKIFAVPQGTMSTSGLFYNKKVLDKLNLAAPKTYADLVAINAALKKNNVSTIAFNGKDIYMWPMWYFQTFAQTSGNKSVERTLETLRGKAKFTDPDYVEAMKALQQFGKDGIFQKGVNGMDGASAKALFANGKAGMFYGGTWEYDGFIKTQTENAANFELGVAPFPLLGDKTMIPQSDGGSGIGLAIYSGIDPKKEDLANKFVEFLTSDEVAQKQMDDKKGVFSVNVKVTSKDTSPIIKDLTDNYLPNIATFLDWYWTPEVTKAFQDNIQAVVGGQKEAEAAMADIQKVFDAQVAAGYNFDKKS